MKTLLFVAALTLTAPVAKAGFDSGNAGDALSSEFIYSGRDVLQRLELSAARGKVIFDTTKLRAVMEATKVVSLETPIYVNGLERDARNFPSKKLIEFNRPRWRQYRGSGETFTRLRLALHEYLWMTDVNDENYVVSERIIRALNVPDYSANVWLHLPGTAFAVVECTGKTKSGAYVTLQVNTKGAANTPENAEVRIEERGNTYGYRFKAEDISQFFESDDAKANTAMIGLGAFVSKEFPVSLKYSGRNFVDLDLRVILDGGGDLGSGNSMKVWKGPRFTADEVYEFDKPVCSIWSNN